MRKRLIFVNRFYYPDLSATSQILTDLATYLASRDADVTVVTGRILSDRSDKELLSFEENNGVRVIRVWTTQFGRDRTAGRAIDYATFYLSSFLALIKHVRNGDTIIAKTDPPLISVVCLVVAKLKRARLVNWVQDLFPEIAEILKVKGLGAWASNRLRSIRNRSLIAADQNVVIGECMRRRLLEAGIPGHKLALIPNWADDCSITPTPREENVLRTQWELSEKFVVGYSGNMGRVHDFDTILGAAEALRSRSNISFLMIGGGKYRKYLEKEVADRKLTNIVFKPHQERSALKYSLGVPDVHLISLRPELEGLVVPSKYYGIIAAGRAAIFIGSTDGEVAKLLQAGNCGLTIRQGDSRALASQLVLWSENWDEVARLGRNAHESSVRNHSRQKAESQWFEELIHEQTESENHIALNTKRDAAA